MNANATRDLYAAEGLRYMPQVLCMLDQNPLSPTYGCGDRQFWLYKSIDYQGGMYGEFAFPLALAYAHSFPGNVYYGAEKIRDLALAVIRNQLRSAHKDGSNDDFYPFERAMGSTAFTLYAMAEAARVLTVDDQDILAFLGRRAGWLAGKHETGRLSNHHALAALGLASTAELTGDAALRRQSDICRDRVLGWQTEEGWFPEYGGFDPGYHTLTLTFLAYLRRITGDDVLTGPLARAVTLAADMVGEDGSMGGEVGSRNSYHFFPHGFELLAAEMGPARYVADRFLDSLKTGRRGYLDENRTFCHYQYNYLQSWLDFADRQTCPDWQPEDGVRRYDRAGLITVRRNGIHAVVSLNKGGVVKASTKAGPMASDTGLVVTKSGGGIYAPAIEGGSDIAVSVGGDGKDIIEVSADFEKIPNTILPSTAKMAVLRLLNYTIGRLAPNLLRGIIQYLLIKRKSPFPVRVRRRIEVDGNGIVVKDRLSRTAQSVRISGLSSSSDLTTIYTASSNSWAPSRIFSWVDLKGRVDDFNKTGEIEVERTWPKN
ncbi:MAG TPA: hypothetical protein ENI55_04465 [Alphaproteobacteria bacterium]|nr:hypothetical protein [Alphaproteobacteria bacterium]